MHIIINHRTAATMPTNTITYIVSHFGFLYHPEIDFSPQFLALNRFFPFSSIKKGPISHGAVAHRTSNSTRYLPSHIVMNDTFSYNFRAVLFLTFSQALSSTTKSIVCITGKAVDPFPDMPFESLCAVVTDTA